MLVEIGSALFFSLFVAGFCYSLGAKHGARQQKLNTLKIRLRYGPSGLLEYTEELRRDAQLQEALQYITKGFWPSSWDRRE